MTWQRIDDDTYIDDTLVTCAEYQLFIDEMKEQGKYYQPDHWNSYQFPKGYAREPVLGVRHSDAVTFCNWLTMREFNKWRYRIPFNSEAIEHITTFKLTNRYGYWIQLSLEKNERGFCWVRGDLESSTYLNFDEQLEKLPKHNIEAELGSKHKLALTYGEILPKLKGEVEYRAIELAYEKLSDEIRKLIYIRKLALHIESFVARTENMNYENLQDLPLEREFLLALQERIAGRSPAFEGIRLVKERIK